MNIMKKIIILAVFIFNCLTVFAQKSFYYTMNASQKTNEKATKLFVEYEIAGIKYKDSLNFNDKQNFLKKSYNRRSLF